MSCDLIGEDLQYVGINGRLVITGQVMAKQFPGRSTVTYASGDDPLGVHEVTALPEKFQGVVRPTDGSLSSRNIAPFGPVEISSNLKASLDHLNLLLVRQSKRRAVLNCVVGHRREAGEVGLKSSSADGYQAKAAESLIDSFV